ncbi:MAG: hypothetical protein ABL857_03820 [Rickettsiales bacterium]
MTTEYVFIPHAVADKCSLLEALHWVAFNNYPLYEYTDDNDDARENLEHNENVKFSAQPDFKDFFTKEVCERYGLPKSPTAEYIAEHNDTPSYCFEPEFADKMLADKTLSEDDRKHWVNYNQEKEIFDREQKIFDDALDDFLEQRKAALFIALKQGNVKASGRNLIKAAHSLKIDISKEVDIDDIWGNADNDDIEFEEILPKEWYMNKVEWKKSYLLNDNKTAFCHILVDVESLFKSFPESEKQTKSVISVNGVFLDNSPHPNTKIKTGRPPYNWHSFHAEMAYRLLKGELPKLQKTCVIEMGEWCLSEWKTLPSETNLKNNISPFYAALKKSETL